jgi:hypothetical protein
MVSSKVSHDSPGTAAPGAKIGNRVAKIGSRVAGRELSLVLHAKGRPRAQDVHGAFVFPSAALIEG